MLHQLNVFHSGDMRHVKVSAFASKNSASTRIALACISCRSKHLKCDAATPVCSRCRADDKQCTYLKSRRGGRRSRKPTEPQAKGPLDQLPDVQSQSLSPFGINHSEWMINDNMPDFARNVSTDSSESYQRPPAEAPSEELLDLYYSFFHNAHPCVLPRRYLAKRLEVDAEAFQPVLLVMQYIGSIYTNSVPSEPLEVAVIEVLAEDLDSSEVNGHYVQALMLYSIAVFWRNDIERGLKLLDRAISKAIQIGMNTQDFAMTYGEGFPVLEESWRRTWWLMCVADAHIAGSTHTYPFRMTNLSVEVDLPCDEDRYDAGVGVSIGAQPSHC